jgi:hypothetical protein
MPDIESAAERQRLGRRGFLKAGAAAAAIAISGTALIHGGEAWGLEVKGLQPQAMKTLIVLARDIYPHDRLADKYYAIAVKPWDEKAAADPLAKAMIENNIAALDALAKAVYGTNYAAVDWEVERVELLRKIEGSEFFEAVRSGLIGNLYNQHEIWPLFGYEGESASKGGYLHRGFNDIEWL